MDTLTIASRRELISVTEAARLANVSRMHVYHLIERGELDAFRVGDQRGPLRIDRQAFLELIYRDDVG